MKHCLKQLLHSGLDPTNKTLRNKTALDILFSTRCFDLDSYLYQMEEILEWNFLVVQSSVECFNICLYHGSKAFHLQRSSFPRPGLIIEPLKK